MAPDETLYTILVDHVRRYTLAYLIGAVLFLSANLSGLAENFGALTRADWSALGWWQLAALVAKSLNAGFVALLGYLMKSPMPEKLPQKGAEGAKE